MSSKQDVIVLAFFLIGQIVLIEEWLKFISKVTLFLTQALTNLGHMLLSLRCQKKRSIYNSGLFQMSYVQDHLIQCNAVTCIPVSDQCCSLNMKFLVELVVGLHVATSIFIVSAQNRLSLLW